MKNWTKWYKKSLEKAKEKNKETNSICNGLSDREKATQELLLKQYGNIENAVKKAQTSTSMVNNETRKKLRENEIEKALAQSKVSENIAREGNNRVNAKISEREELEKSYQREQNRIRENKVSKEDTINNNLKIALNKYEEETREAIRKVDNTYDAKEADNYRVLKGRIDYLLKANDTGSGDVFFDIKDSLLKIIKESKNEISEEKFKELNDYVNSKLYIDKNNLSANVVIYANDEKVYFTAREFEWADKLQFDMYGRYCLIYGDLVNIQYNGKYYKARVGAVATQEDANIAAAIAKRKNIDVKYGTSITFNGKMLTYADNNVWRYVNDRIEANKTNGYNVLMQVFREDMYAITDEEVKEEGSDEKKGN